MDKYILVIMNYATKQQIHIGYNELCNKAGGSKNITNKHKYSDNQIQL